MDKLFSCHFLKIIPKHVAMKHYKHDIILLCFLSIYRQNSLFGINLLKKNFWGEKKSWQKKMKILMSFFLTPGNKVSELILCAAVPYFYIYNVHIIYMNYLLYVPRLKKARQIYKIKGNYDIMNKIISHFIREPRSIIFKKWHKMLL